VEKAHRSHCVAAADILHRLIPNSKIIILPDAGHLPMIESSRKDVQVII
jgi:hypothetical protein